MLGEQIKKLRQSSNLSQVCLARKLGVTKQSISNWENGNIMPSIDMLIRLAEIFGVTTDYLLGLNDKHDLNTNGLSETQVAHVQAIINDILKAKEYKYP